MSKVHKHRKSKSSSRKRSPKSDQVDFEDLNETLKENGNEQTYEIKTSKSIGRYLVATKKILPGEIILKEDPLVVGPCSGCKISCIGCYKELESEDDWFRCDSCKWPLCFKKCPGLYTPYGHTKVECTILKHCNSQKNLKIEELGRIRSNFNAIVPLRCLILKGTNPDAFDKLMTMQSHTEIRKNLPDVWQTNQIQVVDKIIKDWNLTEFSEDEIHHICGILEVNAFEIGQQGINIRGLYPNAFLMSHDCIPNTNHSDDGPDYTLTVRASTPIGINQPITLSYAHTLQSTINRRDQLLENKFFECMCKRCKDPTELETYTGALMCPKCKTGLVISTNPLDPEALWNCNKKNSCLGYQVSAKSVRLLNKRISQESELLDCNDISGMELFLQKFRNVLHPKHYLCIGVKLSLSQLYGKINGYLIHKLNDDMLIRKIEICKEILEVFDIIEPGYTKLRGVTLYELHAPLMVLLTRQFEQNILSKPEIKSKLREVIKSLIQSSVILGFEPKSSSEGAMGVAAKEALHQIKNWEKITGKI